MEFARVNGLTLNYQTYGSAAGVPLVFVNSLGTDLRSWDRVVSHLDADYAILCYDKRGHGLSDVPDGPCAIADYTEDLDALLRYREIENCVLIGISVGGMIALDYASKHPHNVRAMVLCDTAGRIGSPEAWSARIAAIQSRGLATVAEELVPRWFTSDFAQRQPETYHGMLNMLARMPETGYIATCEALRDGDLRGKVPAIHTKTQVLVGAEDLATPPDQVRQLADALPDAQFEMIENAGHLPCIEQPEIMAAKISQFLQENGHV
jgi:3-oxoadipate enol-lactonase